MINVCNYIAPNLKTIGGDLHFAGNKDMSEKSFPMLEYVGGNLIIVNASFTKLPEKLKCIEGDVIISEKDRQ
ncbi:MAG: hypothetical protein KF721_08870 [Ignavibacteriaceae bacterium]|nr:hypothetical protein [Ignavibacteriaceae bacterium]